MSVNVTDWHTAPISYSIFDRCIASAPTSITAEAFSLSAMKVQVETKLQTHTVKYYPLGDGTDQSTTKTLLAAIHHYHKYGS